MSVKEAKRQVDSAELTDWMAFASHEPIGQDRHDLLNGLLCSVLDSGFFLVAKAMGAKFSKPHESTAMDFVPKWWQSKEQAPTIKTTQTVEEQAVILDMYFSALGIKKKPA